MQQLHSSNSLEKPNTLIQTHPSLYNPPKPIEGINEISLYASNLQIKSRNIQQSSRKKNNTERLHLCNRSLNQHNLGVCPANDAVGTDQIIYQLKLKIISFMKIFNIDFQSANTGIEEKLQMLLVKMKEYIQHNKQKLRGKSNSEEVLDEKSKMVTLQEHLYEESKKWKNIEEKYSQQCQKLTMNLQKISEENEELKLILSDYESIIEEQKQYIDSMEGRKTWEGFNIDSILQKKEMAEKIHKVEKLNISYSEQISTLNQQLKQIKSTNQQLQEQMGEITQQNKLYKQEIMFRQQRQHKIQLKLSENQDKLIAYFDMFQVQKCSKESLQKKVKLVQSQLKKQLAQMQNTKKIYEKIRQENEKLKLQLKLSTKQRDQWKLKCENKQINIVKLNKDLQQLMFTYKQKSTSPKKDKDKLEEAYQTKLKTIIQQWKQRTIQLVQDYQTRIQKLQNQLNCLKKKDHKFASIDGQYQKREEQIVSQSKQDKMISSISTTYQY